MTRSSAAHRPPGSMITAVLGILSRGPATITDMAAELGCPRDSVVTVIRRLDGRKVTPAGIVLKFQRGRRRVLWRLLGPGERAPSRVKLTIPVRRLLAADAEIVQLKERLARAEAVRAEAVAACQEWAHRNTEHAEPTRTEAAR